MTQTFVDESTQQELNTIVSDFIQTNKSPVVIKGSVYTVTRKYPVYDDRFGERLVVYVNKSKDQSLYH